MPPYDDSQVMKCVKVSSRCRCHLRLAVKATKWGARLITIGTGAGRVVDLNIGDLLFRTLTCIGTGQRPPADREAIWRRLLAMQKDQAIKVDYLDYDFSDAAEAWAAQVAGPHAKFTAKLR